MSIVFNHATTAPLREREVQPERPSQVEDFVQPKYPLRDRKTGYSAGHIRSVLELDTFGPNHSEFVESMRMSGELPASPNYNRFVGSSPSGGNTVKFDFERTGSTASSFDATGKSDSGSRRPSLGSIDSLGSLGSLSSTGSVRMKTPGCLTEIAEYSDQLQRSTPTAKRLAYSLARQKAQKERWEAKKRRKQTAQEAKLKKQEIEEVYADIDRFEDTFKGVTDFQPY